MNRIDGTVHRVDYQPPAALVLVACYEAFFSALLIEAPSEASVQVGAEVTLVFKETDAVVGLSADLPISIANRFCGTVQKVDADGLLARVGIDYKGVILCALIHNASVERLGIAPGVQATLYVKSMAVVLEPRSTHGH